MVRVEAGRLLLPSLHTGDVTRDVDVEPSEERGEGAVEVVAVAPATCEDALHGLERIDARRPSADDVDGLVRDARDVRRLEGEQRVGVDTTRSEVALEPVEVGERQIVGEALHGQRRRRWTTTRQADSHARPRNAPARTSVR